MKYLAISFGLVLLGIGACVCFSYLIAPHPWYTEANTVIPEEGAESTDAEIFSKTEKLKPDFKFLLKIAAPELVGLENWLNTSPIESLESLRGKVVLIDFWTYSCINCIHTLPYVQALHEKYADEGLVVLGVHAPEFQYERKLKNVQAAVKKNGLTYPIVQDNEFATWRAYKNRYWPAVYLIDKEGFVRYTHFGEGKYEETEKAVRALLK